MIGVFRVLLARDKGLARGSLMLVPTLIQSRVKLHMSCIVAVCDKVEAHWRGDLRGAVRARATRLSINN